MLLYVVFEILITLVSFITQGTTLLHLFHLPIMTLVVPTRAILGDAELGLSQA